MKKMLATLGISGLLLVIGQSTVMPLTYAACPSDNSAKGKVINGISEAGNCDESPFTDAISSAVSILSLIVGIAAIVMIILGGFKYIVSGGESGKVANAKNTVIYALVGLVIAALAQFLVNFVFTAATHPNSPSSSSSKKKSP